MTVPVYNIQYDGFTVLLTKQVTIAAHMTNHIKIAIADYGDNDLDSAVFIKAHSHQMVAAETQQAVIN